MKLKYFILMLIMCLSQAAFADDTDIYGVSSIEVKPNVLIILDNSGSMSTQDVAGESYDPSQSYAGSHGQNTVYKEVLTYVCTRYWWGRCRSGYYKRTWVAYHPDIDTEWACSAAKTELTSTGYWDGLLQQNDGTVYCGTSGSNTEYRLGNYVNFIDLDLGDDEIRMVVAKRVVANLIYDNESNVNFGLMAFNTYNTNDDSGYILSGCGASINTLIGSFNPSTTTMIDDYQSGLGTVGTLESSSYTPLSETLGEAGLYFAGEKSWFNGTATGATYPFGRYSSNCTSYNNLCQNYADNTPIEFRCQKNYIILVTDGEPTRDDDKFATNNYITNSKLTESIYDDNTSYLDDVAYFLAHNDLLPLSSSADPIQKGDASDFEDQTISTYTIGFKSDQVLLQSTATNGGGEYYTANNAAALGEALNNIIGSINENNEVFSAAAVPVSRANKAYAGNYVYYGLFQPQNTGNWSGNLKKYAISDYGVLLDKTGNEATSGGVLLENSWSYWSPLSDGASVSKGGAGELLLKNSSVNSRNIYTYTGTDSDLTDATNLFITTNTLLTDDSYEGLNPDVITTVRHEDGTWPLGAFIHSQPLIVHYDDDNDGTDDHSMIYAGANDGMLHCFDDTDGNEKWGFIPPDLLSNLSGLATGTSLHYSVDGSPILYNYNLSGEDKKLVLFGERRGGYNYTALDITNYNSPLFKYTISPTLLGAGAESLGQSWFKPQLAQIIDDGTKKNAFFITGGYDENQDLETPLATDTIGRAVFAIDAQSGNLLPAINFNHSNFSSMTHSIIAASIFENPKSVTSTRIYAGDMNGNLFAFRDDIFHRNQFESEKADYGGLYDGQEDGVWGQKLKLFSTPGKKIFYDPNIVNEYYMVDFTYPADEVEGSEDVIRSQRRVGDFVFYGTGDRAHPERTDILNSFFAIKNDWQWESETPTIVEAYVDQNDHGTIKAKDDNRVLVGSQRDDNGDFIIVNSEELYILDVTDDLFQNTESDEKLGKLYTTYVEDAIDHPSNRGWFFDLEEINGSQIGEKIVSSPIIFAGVIYFTTYIPDSDETDSSADPCANPGANGSGYLYALGYKYGGAAINFDDPTINEPKERVDRRKKLKTPGIPPAPVIVVHEGKTSILVGFESIDPASSRGMERFYWRQINQ